MGGAYIRKGVYVRFAGGLYSGLLLGAGIRNSPVFDDVALGLRVANEQI